MPDVQKVYDLFISYNQGYDLATARRLQRHIKQIGLPLWKLSRRSVFLDLEGMHAGSETKGTLFEALAASRYFVLLACPQSARSQWVQGEVAAWLTDFKHTDWTVETEFPTDDVDPGRLDRFLICHTGGRLEWRAGEDDFDWKATDALPDHLRSVFRLRKTWQDLSERQPDETVPQEIIYMRAAAIAGAIEDPPKSTEEVLALDRKLRTRLTVAAAFAACLMLVLTAVAIWQWRSAESARIAERVAKEEAQTEFFRAKKIVDDNFTQIAYDMKELPGAGPLRLELMKKALAYYRDFLERRNEFPLDEDMAVAIFNVGLIQLELGQDQEASSRFEEAVAFLKDRAEVNPDDIEIQRSWLQSMYNVAISSLRLGRNRESEEAIRDVIATQSMLRSKFQNDRLLELDLWNSHLGLGSAISGEDGGCSVEAATSFKLAKNGILELLNKLEGDSEVFEREVVSEIAREHLAGAYLNLANCGALKLEERIENGKEAWRITEDLARETPTDHSRFFRAAQACRLMSSLWLEFGDKGHAQVYANRSLLIHYRLAGNYRANEGYKNEYQQDLRFLNEAGLWKGSLSYYEVALEALIPVLELQLGEPHQVRELSYRVALAHVNIASLLLRPYFMGERTAPAEDDRIKARAHLLSARGYVDQSLNGVAGGERIHERMLLSKNLPMWLELTH